MTKRSPDAGVVAVRAPDGSGVRSKSRLRRYSPSLREECRNGAVLRAFGFTASFALRAGIDLSRRQSVRREGFAARSVPGTVSCLETLGSLACLARELAPRRFGMLLAALDRQQQMPLPRVGLLLLARA